MADVPFRLLECFGLRACVVMDALLIAGKVKHIRQQL